MEREIEEGRTSDSRVLYLGIGGTGKEIVARVKAKLKAQGGGALSPKVGFLVIDIDPSSPQTRDLQSVLSPAEMCHPAQGQLPSFVQEEIRRQVEAGTDLKWVGERIPPGEMTLEYNNFIKGTEGFRQVGLLAYLWEESSGGITKALSLAIAGVTEAVRAPISLSVFIVGSLCGGFGSGVLIDVAYLARSIGLEYAAGSCDVSAVLILPGVFRRLSDDAYSDKQRNALAALTELDYFMFPKDQRGSRTCNPNDVDWSLRSAARAGQLLDTQAAIFQSVFLIDNQRNNGSTLGGTETVFPAVADMLVHLSGDQISDRFLEALNNAKATLKRGLAGQDRLGKDMPHYSSLGLARVILPVQKMAIEAAAVLSGDVLAKLQGGTETPAEAAVVEAVRSLELEPAAMAQALGLARGEFVAGLAKAIDLRAPGAMSGRIAAVSQRVAELARQATTPDALRRYCLDTLDRAKSAVIASQDQAYRRSSARLAGSAESIDKVLNERLERMREAGQGLVWFSRLLDRVIHVADERRVQAQRASSRERSEAAGRAEQEFHKAQDKLASCPLGGVRQAASLAAKKCDDWMGQRLDLVTAQMRERVLDDGLSWLYKIAGATQSLAAFLVDTLPGGIDRAVDAMCKKEQDDAPVTDIRVAADGRKHYEATENLVVREKMNADCLKDMTFELREGDLRLSCAGNKEQEKPLSIGTSLPPFEAARDWIEYLAGHLEPHLASVRLDDYITTDEAASRYANACAKEAEAFVRYNQVVQLSEVGDPITLTVVVAPADSRLHTAFSRDRLQGVVCAQDKDPTTALVFKAEIGILGKILQFRKEAAALEASLVSMKGLWTLGQLSHSIFWRDVTRWANLGLFSLSLAASRIRRKTVPAAAPAAGGRRHEYWLDIGSGPPISLGIGLQTAILTFINSAHEAHRRNLWDSLNGEEANKALLAALPDLLRKYGKIIQRPEEVPSAPLRAVLAFRLRDLEV